MKNLTKENFSEALSGNSLVFFHRLEGCPNCDKMLPLVEKYQKEGVNIFGLDADIERDLVNEYAPQWQWSLPLFVYFENGEVKSTSTWIVKLDQTTETLENMPDYKITSLAYDMEIDLAKTRKSVFEKETQLMAVSQEIQRRKNLNNPAQPITQPLREVNPPEPCESCQ